MASDATQQIKDRLSIVDVVSSYVKLEKAGKNFKAKSPFTNEKTPSFYVSPDRGMYHCFSTNQGGDIFTFVEKMEGLDFKGALKLLAERAGVELTPLRPEEADERDRLYAILEAATRFFEDTYTQSPEAQAYVGERGLNQKSVHTWRVGYAPSGWDSLKQHLGTLKFKEHEMEKAGLIKKSEKGNSFYDRFRGRVMFPISDTSGRVIAYSGRILPHESNPEYKPDSAKYINSPETVLFSKSHALYGYSLAKNSIRKLNCSILVEGQMDVVLSHQAGYTNTVASSGTALTNPQLGLLSRLSNNLVMAFDADRAGIASAGKGITLALARGMDVKVAALPKGDDPADLVRRGVEEWRKVVRGAKHVIDFYLDHLELEHKDPRRLRLVVGETVVPYLASIPNKIDQAHFVAKTAERLRINEEPIWEEVKRYRTSSPSADAEMAPVKAVASPLEQFRKQSIEERLAVLLLWQKNQLESERLIDTQVIEARLVEVMGEVRFKEVLEHAIAEENKVLFEAEMLYDESHTLKNDVEELLRNLERESLREAYTSALEELRRAEERQDPAAVEHWFAECKKLGSQLGSRGGPSG